MEAPEKINISIVPSAVEGYTYITCSKEFPNAVEYTRTDTFIEKACEWIKSIWSETDDRFNEDYTGMLAKDFKNFMKGE